MQLYADVAVHNSTTKQAHEGAVKEAIARALAYAGVRGKVEVSVAMVDKRTMRALELEWKGEDKVTDVLSFRFAEGGHGIMRERGAVEHLGEIVICLSYAYAQAKEHNISGREHIITLAAHGAIHLAGIDHERSAREAQKTDEIQKKVVLNLES